MSPVDDPRAARRQAKAAKAAKRAEQLDQPTVGAEARPRREVAALTPDVARITRAFVRTDLIGTVALGLVVLVAAVVDSDAGALANLAVSAVLFVGGCLGFAFGFLRAAGRSRTDVIDLAGLFYLTGSGPTAARRPLLGLWFAQIAIAVVSVPLTSPPFAVMAPVWGIGLITLWAARFGSFPPRPPAPRR